ncbi:hypothetical protein QQF64_008677 [Cirrhinus molitorella]|uniref:Uncharacterized protein n=1 Tax=Cirrhinus molitorella TaxID=172907 RepID=A0ABR3M7N0_9TELE
MSTTGGEGGGEKTRESERERVKTCRGQRSQLAVRWEVSAVEFLPRTDTSTGPWPCQMALSIRRVMCTTEAALREKVI